MESKMVACMYKTCAMLSNTIFETFLSSDIQIYKLEEFSSRTRIFYFEYFNINLSNMTNFLGFWHTVPITQTWKYHFKPIMVNIVVGTIRYPSPVLNKTDIANSLGETSIWFDLELTYVNITY